MKSTFQISGMTCQGCVASVTEKIESLTSVDGVVVDLEGKKAVIESSKEVSEQALMRVLPDKYGVHAVDMGNVDNTNDIATTVSKHSKWVQLRPLFLIFVYLFVASILLNYQNWDIRNAMLDFMGLFYIVFSFFKLLDLKGFPNSFRMYDPLAKAIPAYAWIYPFMELALGLLFLMRLQIVFALIATIIVLGITTFGVAKTLLDKKSIQCACLGTALQLPMTEATIIENTIMLIMAFSMLLYFI